MHCSGLVTGVNLMRLFCVWNKNYKIAWVIAPDLEDALALATETSHISRPTGYRKWKDCTEEMPGDLPQEVVDLFAKKERGLVTTWPPRTEWTVQQ